MKDCVSCAFGIKPHLTFPQTSYHSAANLQFPRLVINPSHLLSPRVVHVSLMEMHVQSIHTFCRPGHTLPQQCKQAAAQIDLSPPPIPFSAAFTPFMTKAFGLHEDSIQILHFGLTSLTSYTSLKQNLTTRHDAERRAHAQLPFNSAMNRGTPGGASAQQQGLWFEALQCLLKLAGDGVLQSIHALDEAQPFSPCNLHSPW